MKLLAFDTSTRWLSVACLVDGRWIARDEPAGQSHSERLLPLVDAVLCDAGLGLADLDAIAFGAGPGSFTGVRIACGVAQGLALGADLPLIPVSTLLALAQSVLRAHGRTRVLACLDARMREVYVAAYRRDDDRWTVESGPAVVHPAEVLAPVESAAWFGAGDGFASYPALATRLGLGACDASLVPDARSIAEIALPRLLAGETVAAADALPIYVRHRVALTTAERDAGMRM